MTTTIHRPTDGTKPQVGGQSWFLDYYQGRVNTNLVQQYVSEAGR